jgi:hypothetical protein
MRPRLALSIGAAFHLLTGLPLLLAPGQSMSAFGFPVIPAEMLIPLRDLGVLLIGVGIINWLARDAVGAPLRGLLLGNIFIRIAIMALNVWELTVGVIPSTVGSAFPILAAINTALIVMFALALRRA